MSSYVPKRKKIGISEVREEVRRLQPGQRMIVEMVGGTEARPEYRYNIVTRFRPDWWSVRLHFVERVGGKLACDRCMSKKRRGFRCVRPTWDSDKTLIEYPEQYKTLCFRCDQQRQAGEPFYPLPPREDDP